MAVYNYVAKKGSAETVEGKIEAFSQQEAIDKISQMGLLAVKLGVEGEAAIKFNSNGKFHKKISTREFKLFNSQLSSLIKAGIPLLEALLGISQQTHNASFKCVLEDLVVMVRDGNSFSQSLQKYPTIFPELYVALVRAGENSGNIAVVLAHMSEYQKNKEEFNSRLKIALLYPAFVALTGIGTVLFMLIYVIPKLKFVFSDSKLPLPTTILINLSQWLVNYWPWLIVIAAALFIVLRRELRKPKGKLFFESILLRLPLFREFIIKSELSRFSYALRMLLEGGVPVLNALKISIPVINSEIIKQIFRSIYKDIEQGISLGELFSRHSIIPAFATNLIKVGEKTGKLNESLQEIISTYEQDINDSLKTIIGFVEPLLILTIGAFVGFIVIAMLLPVLEMNFAVR